MPYSHYPNGFANGVAIRQEVVANCYSGKANVFWVDSNIGSDSNKGTFNSPFSTLDYAIGRCTANNGDIIMLAENHSETITATNLVAADVAGISIIGVGQGNDRPTFTFTTSTAAIFTISAADIFIHNVIFLCGIASQTILVDINAARIELNKCKFGESGQSGLTAIDINGGSANACDGVIINNCEFDLTGANWDRAIELGEVADNVQIAYNDIYGDFDDAGIHNPTGKVLTNLLITKNSIRNLQSGQHTIELVSACTGRAEYNSLYSDAYATTLDPGSLFCVENYSANAIDSSGAVVPAPEDNPSNYIGDNNANNAADTSLVVANADGSVLERLEFIQANTVPDLGGLVFSGTCDAGMAGSTTSIVCAGLAGYGDNYFNTKYYMQIIRNVNSVGNAPEPQVRQITAYVSATGTFTVTAFGANVEASDNIMIVHESVIAIGRDDADNTFASSNVVSNADGSVLERLEFLQANIVPDLGGVAFSGSCNTGMAASATVVVSADLLGYGDDFFNTKYYMQIILNASGAGTAPEMQVRQITDYVSSTGTFTVTAFGANVEQTDKFIVLHESLVIIGRDDADNAIATTNIVANEDGSILERAEQLQKAINNGSGTAIAANKSVVDALGTNGTTVADSAVSVLGAVGADNNNNAFASTSVVANEDGSVLERLEQVQKAVNVGSGTALASNKSLADALGTNGTTVADSAVSVLGAIGADNNDNAFASTNVVANEDGSVLERLEQIQKATNVGSGTALASNKSLADALGTNGTTVADSAVSVLGAIGADNANNAFASTSVVSNADGSVLERQEYVQTQMETVVVRAAANLPQTTTSSIFTIAGGPILVLNIIGEVTTVIQNQVNNTQLAAVPTVGSRTDLCVDLDIANHAVGTFYNITGTLANALVAATNGTAIGQATPVVVPAGSISLDCAASNTGQVRWTLRYKPLGTGVTVTAA